MYYKVPPNLGGQISFLGFSKFVEENFTVTQVFQQKPFLGTLKARNHKKFHPQPPNTRRIKRIHRGSKNTSRRPLKTRFLHQVRQRLKPNPRQPI